MQEHGGGASWSYKGGSGGGLNGYSYYSKSPAGTQDSGWALGIGRDGWGAADSDGVGRTEVQATMEVLLITFHVLQQVLEALHIYLVMMDVIVQAKMEPQQEKVYITQIGNLKIQ
ncbi:MAG: hypothetical protein K2H53_04525 [Clostridia bacterium]|nr:hypothetical protein [Clostridia bacterium]